MRNLDAVDARLLRAIGTPRVQQHATELVRLALFALDDLRQLDESLYERFVATRAEPESPESGVAAMRKLWSDTFHSLLELLAYCASLVGDKAQQASEPASFDFGDLEGGAPAATPDLDLGAADIG